MKSTIQVRKAGERGSANFGWLDARYSFSFANYHDPAHMGFRALRVLNEDRIDPAKGFPTHPHRDMEILTYVIEGQLGHRDALGNDSVLQAGEFQRMTAGTGITHSEFNPSPTDPLHLLQIWILPAERDLAPSWEERRFDERENAWRLVASPEGREGSLTIHQDVNVFATLLDAGQTLERPLGPGRHAWIQVVRGSLRLGEEVVLAAGDGVSVSEAPSLSVSADEDAELLLFDLA